MSKVIQIKNQIKFYHYTTNAGLFSTFLFILLTLLILTPLDLSGEKGLAASGDTSTTSLTLATSGSAELDLLVTSDTGTFASNGTPLEFNVSTNNYTGYTVSIRAKSGTDLTNTAVDGNNNTVNNTFTSISGAGITSDTFNTSTYNGMWGIKPNYYNSTANTDKFYPSPTTSGITLNRTESANASGTSDVYSIGIAARATYAQAAGTYTNTYILSAVGNYPEYKITYNLNGGSSDSSEITTGQSATSTENTETTISFTTATPTKDGFKFIGWCDVDNSADPTTCSGNTYEAGDEYALDLLSSNTKPLYAIWKISKLWFQNATSADCGKDMYDNRGTDTYKNIAYTTKKIGTLCWMTRNLDLPGGTKLTSDDTNLTTGFTLPASSTSGFNNYDTDYVYNSGRTTCSSNSSTGSCYSYYSFYTATAHWGTNSVSSGSSSVDICPKGWRLPTQSEFSSLVSSYSTGSSLVSNWSAVYSGYYYDSSFGNGGSNGYYWSSTVFNAINAYRLGFDSSSADASYTNYKLYGFAIRCVMKGAVENITYLQDINSDNKSAIMASMVENQQYKLKDIRDNKEYYFAKLATDQNAPGGVVAQNGKYYQIWMTQNLDLCIGCNATANGTGIATAALTSENTDLHTYNSGIYTSSTGYSYNNGVITWTPASTAITSGRTVPATGTGSVSGVTGWTNDNNKPYSAEGGSTYVITSGGSGTDTVNTSCSSGDTVCPHYLRGNYYNWTAAIASNDSTSFTTNYNKADNSICPAGWMLPTGLTASAGYSDFNYLLKQQGVVNNLVGKDADAGYASSGFVNIRKDPLYFVRSGRVGGSTLSSSGTYGCYWSGTVSDSNSAYGLNFYSSNVGPAYAGSRYGGRSVRCIVR